MCKITEARGVYIGQPENMGSSLVFPCFHWQLGERLLSDSQEGKFFFCFYATLFVLTITAWVSEVRERIERIKHHKTIFFIFILFYWDRVALYCYVSFSYTAKLIIHTYTYIYSFFFFISFPCWSQKSTE